MTQSLYWHDYEAGGVNPRADRPMQFAGVRTDEDLNIIGKPLVMYCRLAPDYLPHPQACLVTGITPQQTLAEGYEEAEFSRRIAEEFGQPGTTIVGYNNVRYDDEMTRFMFYRNFIDPYAHTWQNNNARWDLLELVRACYALRPEGIQWPEREDGLVSLKLEQLTQANGIAHGQAHDALADVTASIELARIIRNQHPKLYQYCFQQRRKQAVKQLLDKALVQQEPVVYVSGMFGAAHGYSQWVLPLGYHPDNPNQLIAWRLDSDPQQWANMSAEALRDALYAPRDSQADAPLRPGMLKIAINQCPFVAPAKTLSQARAADFNKDFSIAQKNAELIKQTESLRSACLQVFDVQSDNAKVQTDPDLALYDGFFSDQARSHIQLIRSATPEQLSGLELNFDDDRLPSLLFRYRARNWPQTLSENEMQRWIRFCQERLQYGDREFLSLEEYALELEKLATEHQGDEQKLSILKDLYLYAQNL